LPEEVLDRLRSADPCSATCTLCKAPDRDEQVATYRTFPAEFDLRSLHASNSKRPSGVYLDPWR
jgi:hypothetical protein